MFSFESISKIPFPRLKFSRLTTLAIGSGIGAAAGYGILPLVYLIPVGILFFLLASPKRIYFLIAFVLCTASGSFYKYRENIAAKYIPSTGTITGELRCTDRRTSALPTLEPPNVLNCQIEYDGKAFDAAVIFPPEQKRVVYGERFRFTGKIFPATPMGIRFDGSKFTETVPPLYGNRPLLRLENAEKLPSGISFFTPFFWLRDKLLSRLLNHVENPEVRAMAAKMFFSASAGTHHHLHNDFIISGTIHIFSVSGLHVTILAGMILILLKFLPFQWRYLTTAAIVPLYVLCTGASLPSIRAGIMFCIWCVMRSMLFYSPGWSAIMLTWCIFALFAPETVASLGAQYSFGITGALLLLLERLKELRQEDLEITDMMPRDGKLTARRRKFIKHKYSLLSTFLVAIVAFAAGSGISLRRQHLFVPGSIAANCLIPLFTPLLFGTFIFKLACFALPDIFDRFGAWLLTQTFQLLASTVSVLADIFGPVSAAEPALWTVILFYILLFTALGSQQKRTMLICGTLCALILWFIPLVKQNSTGKIIVVNHGSGTPALLAHIPNGSEYAEIIDIPDMACGNIAGRELRREGVLRVRAGFSRGIRNHAAGTRNLARQLPCTAFLPEYKRKNTAAFMRNLQQDNITISHAPSQFKVTMPQKDQVCWNIADGTKIQSTATDSGRDISIIFRDGEKCEAILPWSSIPVIWSVHIPADSK